MAIFKLDVLGLLLQCKSPQGIYSKFKKKYLKRSFYSAHMDFLIFFLFSARPTCAQLQAQNNIKRDLLLHH